ncbi:sodium-dependent phosphate transport protein 2A-like [Haliotis rubra]|uniref:sodium-dependent phosphate transport protein 2A-like n=1 Tax=Haliotis rubra TaxID=36100 RepID=UPI001EE55C6D|nr:sodium-dependent phosphate transport protein 2A-like [Haliotis rubra]
MKNRITQGVDINQWETQYTSNRKGEENESGENGRPLLHHAHGQCHVETEAALSEKKGCRRRKMTIMVLWLLRLMSLLMLLYMFVCLLSLLTASFRLLCGKLTGSVFSNSSLLQNPVTGLMIGILATVLVQSSSTSTSIVVSMVASGVITVQNAIPIVMGANIGTSVTNTIVSMVSLKDRQQFERAFAGATVHDVFNWLTVIVLLPVEIVTGYLYQLTRSIINSSDLHTYKAGKKDMLKVITFDLSQTSLSRLSLPSDSKSIINSSDLHTYKAGKKDMLKVITRPLTDLIVQVDKKVILKIAEGRTEYKSKRLLKVFCRFSEVSSAVNVSHDNGTVTELQNTQEVGMEKCSALFSHLGLSDTQSGILLLVVSLVLLCGCLVAMVKLLNSVMKNHVATAIKKMVNADFPGRSSFLTGYLAILVGAGLTVVVQSSSVFTSTLTPLVGIGALDLERMYPLTLGSNIGTTATAILAALASPSERLSTALQIALCHFFFNISGILIFYPIPILRRVPLKLARFLGKTTAKYRWFALFYLCLMFVLLPLCVFGLSFAGSTVIISVTSVAGLVTIFIIIINILQDKHPKVLPKSMQTWDFLPKPLRSLQPYDDIIQTTGYAITKCCKCCVPCAKTESEAAESFDLTLTSGSSSPDSSWSSTSSSDSTDSAASVTSSTPLMV